MAQDSPPFKEAASLATKIALNVQETSTNAPAAFQDTQLIPRQDDAFPRPNVPTVSFLAMDNVSTFVMLASSSMKASAFSEVVSPGTPRTSMEGVPDSCKIQDNLDLNASPLSSSPMGNAWELVEVRLIPTIRLGNVFLAQLTVTPASATLSASSVEQDMSLFQEDALRRPLDALPSNLPTTTSVWTGVLKVPTPMETSAQECAKIRTHTPTTGFASSTVQLGLEQPMLV